MHGPRITNPNRNPKSPRSQLGLEVRQDLRRDARAAADDDDDGLHARDLVLGDAVGAHERGERGAAGRLHEHAELPQQPVAGADGGGVRHDLGAHAAGVRLGARDRRRRHLEGAERRRDARDRVEPRRAARRLRFPPRAEAVGPMRLAGVDRDASAAPLKSFEHAIEHPAAADAEEDGTGARVRVENFVHERGVAFPEQRVLVGRDVGGGAAGAVHERARVRVGLVPVVAHDLDGGALQTDLVEHDGLRCARHDDLHGHAEPVAHASGAVAGVAAGGRDEALDATGLQVRA
mmetsp:Transcript_41590/g.130291  ORF Transcript_41590/g.130291 Transcript_41590/m.130291 type:complete len:291 (+) Transcript_41590:1913-2785(+)